VFFASRHSSRVDKLFTMWGVHPLCFRSLAGERLALQLIVKGNKSGVVIGPVPCLLFAMRTHVPVAETVSNPVGNLAAAGYNPRTGRGDYIVAVHYIGGVLEKETCPYSRRIFGLCNYSSYGGGPSCPWWDIDP
jgi:hypothetical protein